MEKYYIEFVYFSALFEQEAPSSAEATRTVCTVSTCECGPSLSICPEILLCNHQGLLIVNDVQMQDLDCNRIKLVFIVHFLSRYKLQTLNPN